MTDKEQVEPMTEMDRVELVVPARSEYARTVRMVASELATRADMDLDCVDDVRMAVEEAFVFAVARVAADDLTFTFGIAPGEIDLTVGPLVSPVPGDVDSDKGELYARFILESICDEFEVVERDAVWIARLVKKSG